MDSTCLEGKDIESEVILRFRPGGPTIFGVWSRPETADAEFPEWLGTHGQPGTVLAPTTTIGGERNPVKSWTHKGGLSVARTA